ncbi:UV DNA damage endonuclease [Bacillus pakistanensis]|uniref:UV DNA damage endonuclease n=1 Tax=Rossellomorea pakistanensis TaxID=992288 RepID=A0ABS2NBK8_9BACI|nr:UV DNA damage endonuclease [Bacillus pakistanensis]
MTTLAVQKRWNYHADRLGFVANALSLWDASPSKTMTFKRFSELPQTERMDRLKEITAANLIHTKRILYYLAAHEISVYRLSSSLVPLATHPEVKWDFLTPFQKEWDVLGRLIKQFSIRASFHPNQFTLFTSPREDVTLNAIEDMRYHYKMLEAMGIAKQSVINIHIGGAYGDKATTLLRFHKNLMKLPSPIKEVMTLENDDKTYNVEETLKACHQEGIPMVLDIHHHLANSDGVGDLKTYLPSIVKTWEHRTLPPKIHVSSPKSKKAFRSHADYVDFDFIYPLLKDLKRLNQDVDLMVEAKNKNLAMLKLIEDISKIRGVKRITGGIVEW